MIDIKYIIYATEEVDFERIEIEADSKEEAIRIYNQKWKNHEIESLDYNGNIRYVVNAMNSKFKCDNSYCHRTATKIVNIPNSFYPNDEPERCYYCDYHAKKAETREGATSMPK